MHCFLVIELFLNGSVVFGLPDVSLLPGLSCILGVPIEKLLMGELNQNFKEGGNMRNIKFYVCPTCGNIVWSITNSEISCCGRKLEFLPVNQEMEEHEIEVAKIENDYYLTFEHAMTKEHYLSFVAYVTYDRVLFVKLYPEQNPEVRLPQMQNGKLYTYCTNHGLWVTPIPTV